MGNIKITSDFELSMLKQYFINIIMACDNKDKNETPYIKSVAECGRNVIDGILNNKRLI